RLRRSAAADAVRQDDEIFGRIERLTGTEQLVAERGPQPIRAAAAGPVQEHDTVDDLARGISSGRSERAVVQLELGQHLSARKAEILDHEIALALARPGGLRECGRCGEKNQGAGQSADSNRGSPGAGGKRVDDMDRGMSCSVNRARPTYQCAQPEGRT